MLKIDDIFQSLSAMGHVKYRKKNLIPMHPPLPPSSGFVTFVVEIFHECFDLIKQL